ncbi:MAG: glycosyltransferase family 2 protein [Candidatus Bathyarchaeia archaeon]|nr:glycosyltransferase family 2 protein [Candidatus Bathyarchaeota archaeon]
MGCVGKISVFIPVYRESDLLKQTLTLLLSDPYKEKEIFVVIDEPTQRSMEIVREFSLNGVHFKLNGERRGKVNALNEVIREASGDIFLFLDADVLIDNASSDSFLERIVKEMENAEIVEVKKEVLRDSFVAKVAGYDYIGFALANLFFSRKVGRCLAINGAAFAIKRETFEALGGFRRTICEDLDIATRSFINGARFKFIDDLVVLTKAPSSWREWFNQRKRWAIGAAFWIKDHFKTLRRALRKYPRIIATSLLLAFPSTPLFLISLFIPDEIFVKTLYMLLLFFSAKASLLIFPAAFTSVIVPAIKSLTVLLGNFFGYSAIFYILAKKLKFHFNLSEFTAYYFIMAPLWLILIVASLIRICIKRGSKVNLDWKI